MEEETDQAWIMLLMNLIGGHFDEEVDDLINGIIFSIRDKHHRISLWINDNNNIIKVRKIGLKFKNICKFDEKYNFSYQVHSKAIQH